MISSELTLTLLINAIFFLVLLIANVISVSDSKYNSVAKAEITILGIAFTQYAITFIMENSNVLEKDSQEFAQQIRYIDWLVTTPLLLYTYWKLADVDGHKSDFVLLLFMDLVMIIAGALSEIFVNHKTWQYILYGIGMVAYGIIVWKIIEIMKYYNDSIENANIDKAENKMNLGYFFIFGWLIYPLGYFFNDNAKYLAYSFGDFINKGLYSLALNSVI
jgi:sensory rhodopsin